MPWGPISPARIHWPEHGPPEAPDFGDLYHARAGALAQAREVFLAGSGLPERWQGRPRFTVLETGFGLGHNFLATWLAWRAWRQQQTAQTEASCAPTAAPTATPDAQPAPGSDARAPNARTQHTAGQRLTFVSIEKHPPTRADLQRAHALHAGTPIAPLAAELNAAWPPLTPDLHALDFDGGAVRLLLAFGDAEAVLPDLLLKADAVYLDGFAPRVNGDLWSDRLLAQLPRLCQPGATVATWCVAGAVRQGLQRAGFEVARRPGFGGKRERLEGRFAPRHIPPIPPGRASQPEARQVAVIGAGLAGAAVARALAREGLQVTVLEALPQPAEATSGNAGGLFHSVLHPDDGPHTRWLRAAALHNERVLRPLIEHGTVPGAIEGLLRGERQRTPAEMHALLAAQHQPPEHVQALPDAGRPGMPSGDAAWLYPGGGWVSPAALVQHWLTESGAELRCGQPVARLQPRPDRHRWRLLDAAGQPLAEADAVVLCNAQGAQPLLAASGLVPDWPLQPVRGQTTILTPELSDLPAAPRLAELPLSHPLADGGYALRLADGRVLCGAVAQPGDPEPAPREADHRRHLQTLQRLTGWPAPADDQPLPPLQGRVGWRLVADDRLPVLGAVPAGDGAPPLATASAACAGASSARPTSAATAASHAARKGATSGAINTTANTATNTGTTGAFAAASNAGTVGAATQSQGPHHLRPPAPHRPPRPITQVRDLPRVPGLWVFTALGSRGITQAALAGELLAARIAGTPLPLPLSVLDALDPGRWRVRQMRRQRQAPDGRRETTPSAAGDGLTWPSQPGVAAFSRRRGLPAAIRPGHTSRQAVLSHHANADAEDSA